MPTATEDAKSEPGSRGTEGIDGDEEEDEPPEVETGREYVGS